MTEHTLRLHNKYVWGEVSEISAATVTHHTPLSPLHRTYLPSEWTVNFLLLSQSALRKDSPPDWKRGSQWPAPLLSLKNISIYLLLKKCQELRGWREGGVLTVIGVRWPPSPTCSTGLGFVNWEWQCAKDPGEYLFHSCHLTNEETEAPGRKTTHSWSWRNQMRPQLGLNSGKNTQSLKGLPFPPPVLPDSGCFTSTNLLNSLSLTFLIWTVGK